MTAEQTEAADPARVMFAYLGRRGPMSRFTLEAMQAARFLPDVAATAFVSRQNENFAALAEFGAHCVGVDTFQRGSGALLAAWRIPALRRTLAAEIRRHKIDVVIELMPHIWSLALTSVIRGTGARYATIVHDVSAHPGDATALVNSVLGMAAVQADRVITLSTAVTAQLRARRRVAPDKIMTLFLPDLTFGPPPARPPRATDAPLRLLFLGRIVPYKGLGLFVDAVETLRRNGIPVEAGVFGEGDISVERGRLQALGAETANQWLSDDEIAAVLARHDVVVVSHIEASQSAVIATAFGAGLPVIATPVGALPEQVAHGVTGLIAEAASAEALAATITRLALDPGLYRALCEGVRARRDQGSMQRFVHECSRIARE